MVWHVELRRSGNYPVELGGSPSGTLVRPRVIITVGHFTAPVKALGRMPFYLSHIRELQSNGCWDPGTWIAVIAAATHPSMPHCPPPPQCDPTDDILVAVTGHRASPTSDCIL